MCWDSPANGVPSTARRARVFLRTRRYTPDLRAFARNSVMRPLPDHGTLRRRSTLAFASCAETSATTAFFLSKIETQGLPPFVKAASHEDLRHPRRPCIQHDLYMGFANLRRTEGYFPPIKPFGSYGL